jgi:predicted CXXCH cytochrome family protein
VDRDVFAWVRSVIITAIVVMLGFAAIALIGGRAYASLPAAIPGSHSNTAQLAPMTNPHGPNPACVACHRGHTGNDAALLDATTADSAVCTRCHTTGGADAVSPHSNIDFGGAQRAPFYTSCTVCHDPHADPAASPGNKNLIRGSIAGQSVVFTASTGPGSYDDGLDDGQHNSVCVVCHTTTAHNAVTSTELVGQGHDPVGGDCLACHPHGSDAGARSGFMPDATATPTATATATETATPAPTNTAPAPTATDTGTPAPTATWTPTPTDTPLPTDTPTATATP